MKLRAKTKQRIRGSLTVLLVIILLPMMTFSALIVDMSRVNLAREMVSSAGDLTMNSALANYDTILKDVYGLFAMSQSEDDLADNLQAYFENTLVSYGVVEKENAGDYVSALMGDFHELISGTSGIEPADFLKLSNITVEAEPVANSSLAQPGILRKQIVEYMKYRAPLNFGMSFLDSLKSFQSVSAQSDVVETQVKAQESTQNVTQACSKLIKLIREYDDLVMRIDSGSQAVKGLNSSTDGIIIPLADYDTQVDKYRASWADNYAHINKLNLVFLANSPSVDSVYLKGLDYPSSVLFIKTGGTGLVYSGSGINVAVSPAGTTADAKSQVESQITNLNNGYKSVANAYPGGGFISSAYLTYNYTSFTDENAAINAFIAYEKFLLDQSGSVKYSDVKLALEEIYKLGKYFDNYKTRIDADVNTALNNLNTANAAVTDAQNYAAQRETWNDSIAADINNKLTTYRDNNSFNFLSGIDGTLYAAVNSVIYSSIPSPSTKLVSDRTFYNYGSSFYSDYYLRNAGDAEDKYMLAYKDLAQSTALKNNSKTYKKICEAAYSYLSYTGDKSFESYMTDKAGSDCTENELYLLLECLSYCSARRVNAEANISEYITNMNGYPALVSAASEAKRVYDAKVAERENMTSKYHSCLLGFYSFSAAYQQDAYYYSRYITTARNMVAKEAAPVNTQFAQIKENIKQLRDKLDAISKQITVTQTAITEYNKNIDAWETANNQYEAQNSSDSFSKQNTTDIETARNEYDAESFDVLDTFVKNLRDEFGNFYTYLTDAVHYQYGNKKIDTITGADHLISAVSGIKSSLSSVVTVEEATEKFAQLYNADQTPECVPFTVDSMHEGTEDQLCFLEPTVLQIQILKYINSAYPDGETLTDDQKTENATVESDYNTQKDKLVEGSGGSVDEDEGSSGGYGYTYKGKGTIPATDLPSKGKNTKETGETEFKLKENTDEDGNSTLDASSGVSQQGDTLSSMLSGIGSALNAGLENVYILNYIFENFSYNALIQTAVMEDVDLSGIPAAGQLAKAVVTLQNADLLDKYMDKQPMLSNYPKNGKNNHLYGAEVEYILYGNLDPAKNVTYAKASIYAVRFGFNCIYAFTNSEIRNTTMAAGLAVQAATLGIVPYQVVQIVLQLALAAAESANDLAMMTHGLKVAVVKTTDTWAFSISGVTKATVSAVTNVATGTATNMIKSVTNGLQSIVDAGADQLGDAIYDLSDNLETATKKVITDTIDQAFAQVTKKLEDGLNSLQHLEAETEAEFQATKDQMFTGIRGTLESELEQMCAGSELTQKIQPYLVSYCNDLIDAVEDQVDAVMASKPSASSFAEQIAAQISSIKLAMSQKATAAVSGIMAQVNTIASDAISEVQGELNGYIEQAGEELSEQVSEAIKENVQNLTNDYIGKYLDVGNTGAVGGGTSMTGGSTSSSVASMIKFGYKDYLMLFTFLSICVNDDPVLLRTADVIQMNVRNAGEGANYQHSQGKNFKMSNAATYISVTAKAELNMFFLNLDLFSNVLSDGTTDVQGQLTSAATIEYKGILGY